jgi:NAD(P)-dependent dehydrogenase (short-subunit alcohol dehydrogenase family)
MDSVVVTGASSGIGLAVCQSMLAQGWQVFGSVRKPEDGQRLAQTLGPKFRPLNLDVNDEDSVIKAAGEVRQALGNATLRGLVNNSGIALADPLIEQSTADFRAQINTNLVGAFIVTKAFAPLLGSDASRTGAKGRVVNMSSTAGQLAFPFLGAYVASKHGLEGLSASFRRELMLFGIDVLVVAPGFIKTPIWSKAEAAHDHKSRFDGTPWRAPLDAFTKVMLDSGAKGLSAQRVAEDVVHALTAARPKTHYSPVQNKLVNFTIPRWLPPRVLDAVVGKQFKLKR